MIKINPFLLSDILVACYVLSMLLFIFVPEYIDRQDTFAFVSSKGLVHFDKSPLYNMSKDADGQSLIKLLDENPNVVKMLKIDRLYDKLEKPLTFLNDLAMFLLRVSAVLYSIFYSTNLRSFWTLMVFYAISYIVAKLINWYITYKWFYLSFPRFDKILMKPDLYRMVMSKDMSSYDRELISLLIEPMKE